ncbi:MAG: spermidine synthase [Caldimonas sp.]
MSSADRPVELPAVTISESRGIRYLHLGTPWIQGAMRIDDPLVIDLEYVQRMMAWLLFRSEGEMTEGHVVQLGLGAGAITRFCLGRLAMRTTVVEINPDVIAACRMWFKLPHAARGLEMLTMDAAEFVADPQRRGSADVLAVDLYDHEAASPVLDSEEFYRDCHALLADGGIMTVNLFGRLGSFERSGERIASAFGINAMRSFKPTREGNAIVLAMKQVTVPGRGELARRAENIETRWQLPARKWLRMMRSAPDPDSNLPPA